MTVDVYARRRARPDAISDIFVKTSRSEVAWRRIDALVEEGWEKEYCKALLILGHFRCGKTEIVTRYAANREEKDRNNGGQFRWKKVVVPPDCTLKGFASAALIELGDPDPDYGTQVDRTHRIVEAIRQQELDLLIIDEAQRLIDTDTERVQKKSADWLAGLLDARCCPLLLVGERRVSRVFENNAHLAGRTMGKIPIAPFDWAEPADRNEFRHVLNNLDKRLGMAEPCGLHKLDISLRLYVYSEGRLGWVANLLDLARSIGRAKSAPQLTEELLAEACDLALMNEGRQVANPFRLNNAKCQELLTVMGDGE